MNYYQPAKITAGDREGKYIFAYYNRRQGWFAVGYCVDCPGHDTAEEACEHFRQYLIGQAEYTEQSGTDPCEVCGEHTSGLVILPRMHGSHPLCESHLNREGLEQVVKKVSYSIASV